MRRIHRIWVFSFILLITLMAGAHQQTGEQLFQSGIYAEEVEGDLTKAIEIYLRVLEEFPNEKTVGAKAQLHLGYCYEKLGRADAIKAYERVLEKFGGQSEQVAAARARLAMLQDQTPQGIHRRKLLEGPDAGQAGRISPDGTKVLIRREIFGGENIGIYDLGSGKLDYITHNDWSKGDPGVGAASWSPDGTEIVFRQTGPGNSGPSEIVVSDLKGKARMIHRIEDKRDGFLRPIAWLPRGGGILGIFIRPDKIASLGVVPLEGKTYRPFYTLKGSVERRRVADPSPDGRFVVFQEKDSQGRHDIHIIRIDGTLRQVLSDHPADEQAPRWSPDGRHIVFKSQRHGSWALWGMPVRDGNPTGEAFFIMKGNPGLENWIPKGLAFHETLMVQDIYTASFDPDSLEVTGKPRQIDYTPTGGNVCPIWSPDGNHLAFVAFDKAKDESRVVIVSAQGTDPREYPNPAQEQVPLAIHDLCWLPDGSGISLSDYNGRGNPQALHLLNLETGAWKSWSIPVLSWTRTAWNKEGTSFLYIRNGQDNPGIIERNAETGAERYVLKQGGVKRGLKFSRDYSQLAFTIGNTRTALLDMETGKHRILTSEHRGGLTWSPDGRYLICTGNRDKLWFPTGLFILSATDGSARRLDLEFPEGYNFFDPTWSPDGKQIAFMAQSMKTELFLMKNIIPESLKK